MNLRKSVENSSYFFKRIRWLSHKNVHFTMSIILNISAAEVSICHCLYMNSHERQWFIQSLYLRNIYSAIDDQRLCDFSTLSYFQGFINCLSLRPSIFLISATIWWLYWITIWPRTHTSRAIYIWWYCEVEKAQNDVFVNIAPHVVFDSWCTLPIFAHLLVWHYIVHMSILPAFSWRGFIWVTLQCYTFFLDGWLTIWVICIDSRAQFLPCWQRVKWPFLNPRPVAGTVTFSPKLSRIQCARSGVRNSACTLI